MLDKRALCVLGSNTNMAGVTLEQKRLEQLKQQLFGKEQTMTYKVNPKAPAAHISQSSTSTALLEPQSLKSDLIKIALLSIFALGIQFVLFFANKNGLISLF